MTAGAMIPFAAAELEDPDLFAPEVLHDLGDDLRAFHRGGADRRFLAVVDEDDLAELHLGAVLGALVVELEGRAFFRAVLPAAVLEDRVHGATFIANGSRGSKRYFTKS